MSATAIDMDGTYRVRVPFSGSGRRYQRGERFEPRSAGCAYRRLRQLVEHGFVEPGPPTAARPKRKRRREARP